VRVEVLGQLFDNKVCHFLVHLQGERCTGPKLLISMEKLTIVTLKSLIQEIVTKSEL
jgi:hypothetical protein